jgi:hypothetical protein
MRERKAMSELGYEVNRDIDDQYQAYHGAPVHDTIMTLIVSCLMVMAIMMALAVIAYWAWGRMFREKKLKSYTGGGQEMVYLRDQQ